MLQVDSNGNGSLDSREIELLLNSLATDALGEGRRVSKAEIRNVMEKVDSNKDRRIAFDEFIRVGNTVVAATACLCYMQWCCTPFTSASCTTWLARV